ncbi:homoserine kinase [Labrys sp. KNU-23]|uniref:phosphotransferase enzyme family protein n=1 Tax=Labrys sp. KNU-23 TaxID=2789216 RepID=UPI0011EC9B3C|nr:homoserine kinase [Labrys sp. KNU-23]QEN85373.1 homoserine kinase [Labrys sp. KNU-23]
MVDDLEPKLKNALLKRAGEALLHWPVPAQQPNLLKYRENAVFRILLADGQPAALRLHRAGYHDEAALQSELAWMTALRRGGLAVPASIPTADGRSLVPLAGGARFAAQHADVVSWIDGAPLGQTGTPLAQPPEKQAELFFRIGQAMAIMHDLADAWPQPPGFHRSAWDADGLVGEQPLWGRFWDCPGLSPGESEALATLRNRLRQALDSHASRLDYGLIHADLVRENVFTTNGGVAFIDFDDCGPGYRLFDVATTLLKNRGEPTYPAIERALIAGYRSRRSLSDETLAALPLFLTLRSLTYIGWLAQRPETPNAAGRLSRYLKESLQLADALQIDA